MSDPQLISSHVLCTKCGYDLHGLYITGKCPECGTETVRSVPECPRCARTCETVIALVRSDVRPGVWSCSRCEGIGFEPGKLRRELSEWTPPTVPPAELVDLAAQTGVKCGRCRVPTHSFLVSGSIMVDRCESCGFLWLDAGEFAAVAVYVREVVGSRRIPADLDKILHDPAALRKQLGAGADLTATGLTIDIIGAVLWALASLWS